MTSDTRKPLSIATTALCLVLAISPAVALAACWGMLPQTVAAHWGAEGIDRWGSKIEMTVVPAVGFIASGLLVLAARRTAGDERVTFLSGALSERVVMVVLSIAVSLVGLASTVFWICRALEPEAAVPGEVTALAWQVLGVPAIFLVAGILLALRALNMPEDDPYLGEQYHAQRIAGAIMVVAGALMAVLSALILPAAMVQAGQAAVAAIAMILVFILLKPWL